MKPLALLAAAVGVFVLVPTSNGDDACRYMNSRKDMSGYESGGPYILDHFRLTKGRTDLREFLWKHWHGHIKAVAEANAGTVDRGVVKLLYVIQPDSQGRWGIDVEVDRPMDPPCVALRADSLVRLPIPNPDEDYPSQTIGLWPPGKISAKRLADSEAADSKSYRVVLVLNDKPVADAI
jgi:hypothetical protein